MKQARKHALALDAMTPPVANATSAGGGHGGIAALEAEFELGGFFGLVAVEVLAGQEDGTVEAVGQATVAASDLHGDYNELANNAELRA